MSSLAGKVFAITGGASGMGLATARMLAEAKARAVAIGDFNTKNFEAVTKELQGINPELKVLTTKLDVASSESVDSWIEAIISEFGALDGAVNAAGVPQAVNQRKTPTILEETNETWSRTVAVNLNGVFYCTRAEIKAMVALPKAPRGIVNIASIAALVHGPDCYGYGASKNAVVYFSASVAKDVLPLGIRVNSVCPGATNTPMLGSFFGAPEGTEIDTAGWGVIEASDIAEAVFWLLSDKAKQVAGVNIPVGPGAP